MVPGAQTESKSYSKHLGPKVGNTLLPGALGSPGAWRDAASYCQKVAQKHKIDGS